MFLAVTALRLQAAMPFDALRRTLVELLGWSAGAAEHVEAVRANAALRGGRA